MLASEIMDRSAALLNDRALSKYTYVAQLPYLNTALDELMEELEANDISITQKVLSPVETITAGTTTITSPTDLVEIQTILEADVGASSEDFIEMERARFLPKNITPTTNLRYWTYQDQVIITLGATANRDVKMEYIAKIQTALVDHNSQINIINSKSYLSYKNAALCARFIGENPTRGDSLDILAGQSLDRMLGINIKAQQDMPVKRKPFMFAFKRRGSWK